MAHTRIRKFNTKDTYPEQNLDNDLCQAVVTQGGRIVWLYAAHSAALKAGVAWYGRVVGDSTPMTPKHPVDIAKDLKAPVLGLYGGADTGIPLDTIDTMKKAFLPFLYNSTTYNKDLFMYESVVMESCN